MSIRSTAIAIALLLTPRLALAGGFEIPDNGTQALGRGGAFVAKASDPTAIYHNPAGLAQQRGTRLLANANISFQAIEFQRSGTYPGSPSDPGTPWAGTPFPVARETAGACVRALNVTHMKIGPQIDPGVPWCHARTQSTPAVELHLALKSGNFGADDFFSKAFSVLR